MSYVPTFQDKLENLGEEITYRVSYACRVSYYGIKNLFKKTPISTEKDNEWQLIDMMERGELSEEKMFQSVYLEE